MFDQWKRSWITQKKQSAQAEEESRREEQLSGDSATLANGTNGAEDSNSRRRPVPEAVTPSFSRDSLTPSAPTVVNISSPHSLIRQGDEIDARNFKRRRILDPSSGKDHVESLNPPSDIQLASRRSAAASDDIVTFYKPGPQTVKPSLLQLLKMLDPEEIVLKDEIKGATAILENIGPCAADLIWSRFTLSLPQNIPEPFLIGDEEADRIALEKHRIITASRDQIRDWPLTIPNLNPTAAAFNVTHKFVKLVQILQCFDDQATTFKGIIFVDRRHVALAIEDMIRALGVRLAFLRPRALVRPKSSTASASMDIVTHQDVVEEFRTGKTNLLIATRVIEDDVDLPLCTAIIRFDPCPDLISYAQSRARVEMEGMFIHMVEEHNDRHRHTIYSLARLDSRTREWVDAVADNPSGAIPPRAVLDKQNIDHVESDDEDAGEHILDPTTGGRIHLHDSVSVIYRYVAASSSSSQAPPMALFEYETNSTTGYVECTVNLPPESPITKHTGPLCPSKADAKRQACYDTCMELFRMGFLHHTFFPRPTATHSFLPDAYQAYRDEPDYHIKVKGSNKVPIKDKGDVIDSNGQVIKGRMAGTRPYTYRRPAFWKNSLLTVTFDVLYPTVILISSPNNHRHMCLLARHPLPPINPFNLHRSGETLPVTFKTCKPFKVTESQIETVHGYTVRCMRLISERPLANDLERTAYFLVPMKFGWTPGDLDNYGKNFRLDIEHDVDWEEVETGAKHWARALKTESMEALETDLEDAILQDRWSEFTRRFHKAELRRDLTPLSKPPEGVMAKQGYTTFLEYFKARRKDFEGITHENQPMICVQTVPPLVNNLSPSTSNPPSSTKQYLVPEFCIRCTVSGSTYSFLQMLPSIMRRIDDCLIVKEINAKIFDNWVKEEYLLPALTPTSAGADFNYERLEILGDAFLKCMSTTYLFVTAPNKHENAMHFARQGLLSNRALLQFMRKADIPQYIRSKSFGNLKGWLPYNFKTYRIHHPASLDDLPLVPMDDEETDIANNSVVNDMDEAAAVNEAMEDIIIDPPVETPAKDKKEKGHPGRKRYQRDDARVQWLGDKAVADVGEALIGAACLGGTPEDALKVAKDVGLSLPSVDRWSDFGRKALMPTPESTAELSEESHHAIEAIVRWKIRLPHVLAQALTHKSLKEGEFPTYERLEFLGDAVLDYLTIRYLWNLYQDLSPGQLTLMKGGMVTNAALAAICVKAGLSTHILCKSQQILNAVKHYEREITRLHDDEHRLAKLENRPPGQYWADVDPPKELSDVVESILGAIFVSDNFSMEGVQSVFDSLLKPFYEKHISLQTLNHHPTKTLFELLQGHGCSKFEMIKEDITESTFSFGKGNHRCDVICHDIILSSVTDSTINAAARRASFFALATLEDDLEYLKTICDCRSSNAEGKTSKNAGLLFDKMVVHMLADNVSGVDLAGGEVDDESDEDEVAVANALRMSVETGDW